MKRSGKSGSCRLLKMLIRYTPTGGLLVGGAYTRGAYKIIVDIEKTLAKDLIYFSRNFFMSI